MINGLLKYVKKNHRTMSAQEMADCLGTTEDYILAVCRHNGLKPSHRSKYIEWTDQEIQFLKEVYPDGPRKELVNNLRGRKWTAIKSKACKLGIKRNQYV